MKSKVIIIIIATLLGGWGLSFSQEITSIQVKGNKNISIETIFSKIKIKKGLQYNPNIINEDIKRLYETGFFEDVEVETKESPEGVEVIFIVEERPKIEKLEFRNLKYIHPKKILPKIQTKEGSLLDIQELKEDISTIEDMFKKKGFSQVEVSYEIERNKIKNTAKVIISVDEGARIKIKKILIEGNKTFSDKRILKYMKTRPPRFFWGGYFQEEVMEEDLKRIKDFYQRQGFSDVKVDYFTEVKENFLFIKLYIKEGSRYFVGDISVEGNKVISQQKILGAVKTKPGSIFVETKIKDDALRIQELYIDRGYIFAQVRDYSLLNPQTGKVDVTFKIQEREVAYIGMIKITGNTKTRDDVIRREVRLRPGDRFDGKKLRRTRERLENLGIFEEVRFDSEPAGKNRVNLIIDVKEAKTGSISFGGGYSSVDEFVGFIEFAQNNFDWRNFPAFTGGAQILKIAGEFGTVREFYNLSFTNPWIFDRPISFGFDAYGSQHIRESGVGYGYDEKRTGGDVRFGYEFREYLRGKIALRFENIEISNVPEDATQELKKEVGKQNLRILESALIWDKRDNIFSPRKGFYTRIDFDNALDFLGSDREFYRIFSDNSLYLPLFLSSVLQLRARVGIVKPYGSSNEVPIFERFFAGGAGTIRGYQERKVGPIDTVTKDPIGGESIMVFNIEYIYPIFDFLKLAAFLDSGNVWRKVDDLGNGDFKTGVGLGIRVKTPLGPIKLDYGWPLNLEPGEEKKEGRFHFSISRGF